MAFTSRMKMLAAILAVACTISGCQSSGNWMTAWKERTKPKAEFKDPNNTEQLTYWPYKSVKNKAKLGPVPPQLQEKMAQRSAKNKYDSELNELINSGDLLRKNNQLPDARLAYEKALEMSPDNADVHRRLAIVADMQGRFSAADEHYQATLRLRPRDVDVLSDKGYSYILRGNAQQAELVLREALLIDPSHKKAMANLGALYAQQNRYPEALALFRAGGTESEAQQNIAKFFPQGPNAAGPNTAMVSATQDPAQSKVVPAIASAVSENPPDLSKLSLEQIQAEMARRRQVAEQRRYAADQRKMEQTKLIAEAERAQTEQGLAQLDSMPQRRDNGAGGVMTLGPQGRENLASNSQSRNEELRLPGASLQAGLNASSQDMNFQGGPPMTNQRFQPQDNSQTSAPRRETEIFRGPGPASQTASRGDSQFQRGSNPQLSGRGSNQIQQTNDLNSRQMVTQLGMSAGPGMLFPAPQPRANNGYPPNGFDARFGSDFSPPSANQNGQNWSGNLDDQRRGNNESLMDDDMTTNPPSPASNWGPPSMMNGPNWQNGMSESSDWSNEYQSGTNRSTGFDQTGGQAAWGQNESRRSAGGFDNMPQGFAAPNRNRTGNDLSRPYNGAWPNSNAIPPRQNQTAPDNTVRFDMSDQFGGGSGNAQGTTIFGNQNMPPGSGSGNSLPQWPGAPNR